jgi:hypothetical protein
MGFVSQPLSVPLTERMLDSAAGLRRGGSADSDAWGAIRELHQQIGGRATAFVLVFCAATYDRAEMARALAHFFGDTPVFGCTTAGEITPFGYISGGVSGIAFPSSEFTVAATLFEGLSRFDTAATIEQTRALIDRLDTIGPRAPAVGRFALLLIDGMSVREEQLVSAVGNTLAGIPLLGGSAGDGLDFGTCHVIHRGRFVTDAAALLLVQTARRFSVFKTEHFVATDRKMVVTGADLDRRRVYEINGEPAALEYARLLGLSDQPLTPRIFAAHPVMVRVGGQYHVRAIQRVNPDNSLTFFCAIDEGLVLTLAESVDILENLHELFERLDREVGKPELVIGCDCVLRNLELEERQLKRAVSNLFVEHRMVGFCTYGEQYMSMHVNQTLTGIAIGAR